MLRLFFRPDDTETDDLVAVVIEGMSVGGGESRGDVVFARRHVVDRLVMPVGAVEVASRQEGKSRAERRSPWKADSEAG